MIKLPELPRPGEPYHLRIFRVVAAAEGISFVVLLIGSVLKRTTDFNPVPVLGVVHAVLFLAVIAFTLENWKRLAWEPWFALVMLTVGSPGVHFALSATEIVPDPPRAPQPPGAPQPPR